MLAVMQCDPCGKKFTGPVCYNQHLESEKHKRKVLNLSHFNGSSGAGLQAPTTTMQISNLTVECHVCQITFNSLNNFQTHSVSPEHAQKVLEKDLDQSKASEAFSRTNHILNFEANSSDENVHNRENDNILPPQHSRENDDILPSQHSRENRNVLLSQHNRENGIFPPNEMIKSQVSFTTCSICNKIFSGPEPYKQHIESVAHKKNVDSSKINQNITSFFCDPCKKSFSGQIPYLQHMKSEIHRKKVLTLELLEKEISVINSGSGIKKSKADENNQNNPWFCNICQKQCSGYIPFKQHNDGITHLKNVVRAKRENSNFNSADSTQLATQNKSEGKSTLDASSMVNGGSIQIIDSNRNMDVDYILPDMEDKLKLMSSEELENSVTIFLPDQAIDFDKSDNVMNLKNEEMHTSEDAQVHEIKENSIIYQTCNFCNVNLWSKEEALNHFESLEHVTKRWQQN